jgi:RNA polymerase sigma-70 factor (ECF subfamily)
MYRPPHFKGETEEALCALAVKGDKDAFLELFERNWDLVFRVAFNILRNQAEAEDIAQAVFTEVHERVATFNAALGTFRGWLMRYTYTRTIDRKRELTSRCWWSHDDLQGVETGQAEGSWSPFQFEPAERAILIEQALAELNEKQRNVIEAYFMRGATLRDIACEMDESEGNVRHLFYRGLAKLRTVVKAFGHEFAEEKKKTGHLVQTGIDVRRSNNGKREVLLGRARAL